MTAQPFLGRGRGAYGELSISNGGLRLADATFTDPVGIITSAAKVHNGLYVVCEDSASATINTLANAALWVWPITRDSLGNRITGPVNLTERDSGLWLVERYNSLPPTLLTAFCGFSDLADIRVLRQQLLAIGWGSTATSARRGEIITVDAGGAETRTAGTASTDEHIGYSGQARRQTHEQLSQFRGYPIGADGKLTETPGSNATVSTASIEMNATGFFFVGVNWNSVSGTNGAQMVFDPSYHLGPYGVPS